MRRDSHEYDVIVNVFQSGEVGGTSAGMACK